MMQKVHTDQYLSHPTIHEHEWFKQFKGGRKDVNEDERSGCSRAAVKKKVEIVTEFRKKEPKSYLIYFENIKFLRKFKIMSQHSIRILSSKFRTFVSLGL